MSKTKPEDTPRGSLAILLIASGVMAWILVPRYFVIGPAAARADAVEFMTQVKMNPTAAYAKYDGKIVELTGPAWRVGVSWGTPTVQVGVPIFNTNCALSKRDAERASRLQRAENVTVRGRASISGSSMTLKPCRIR